MEEQEDKAFLKNLSVIMVVLVILTFAIVFVARMFGVEDDVDNNPSRELTFAERTRPVAGVYMGDEGAAAIQAAASHPEPEQAQATNVDPGQESVVAVTDGPDGAALYTSSGCTACHETNVAGAPKPGSDEMAARAEKGIDVLMESAINGLNVMPARGGRPDLTDEQIRAIVEFMLQ